MKELLIYYSYTGKTEALAQKLAAERGADLCPVLDVKRPGTAKAYAAGSFAAMRGKGWPIQPLGKNPAHYDSITLLAPIWAGSPAPQIYTVLERLKKGTEVRFVCTSGTGNGKPDKAFAAARSRGCRPMDFKVIKNSAI